ncbi:MAG: phosphatidylinositol-specific phospholipase C/glycerophosphodiester phosphodiesterase family protein [Bacteroidota bacterium]|nr:phosphatidylinositol-specific phospholipase C/glycerophosphodiester phosphodiesterase family protein [Bacteroidota bacterium]
MGQPRVYSVENTHSHNDYEQKVPFFTAYKAGFGSIEADIFLVDNKLIVAHDSAEMLKHRTLESLYLIPLLTATQNHYGFVYGDSSKVLQMLIDIKTDSIKTLDKLVSILKSMPELSNNRSIRWVISGNRPDPSLFSSYPSFIQFDGVLSRDYSPEALPRISMMSNDFEFYSGWKGEGPIPAADLKILQTAVQKSHALHKPVRFWDAPDNKNAWTRLMQLQVDFINTDHIQELAEFLGKE